MTSKKSNEDIRDALAGIIDPVEKTAETYMSQRRRRNDRGPVSRRYPENISIKPDQMEALNCASRYTSSEISNQQIYQAGRYFARLLNIWLLTPGRSKEKDDQVSKLLSKASQEPAGSCDKLLKLILTNNLNNIKILSETNSIIREFNHKTKIGLNEEYEIPNFTFGFSYGDWWCGFSEEFNPKEAVKPESSEVTNSLRIESDEEFTEPHLLACAVENPGTQEYNEK